SFCASALTRISSPRSIHIPQDCFMRSVPHTTAAPSSCTLTVCSKASSRKRRRSPMMQAFPGPSAQPRPSSDASAGAIPGTASSTTGPLPLTASAPSSGNGRPAVADTVTLQRLIGDAGSDDNFHVTTASPTIDAADPQADFTVEPAPNGGRLNQGYDGNTAQ